MIPNDQKSCPKAKLRRFIPFMGPKYNDLVPKNEENDPKKSTDFSQKGKAILRQNDQKSVKITGSQNDSK